MDEIIKKLRNVIYTLGCVDCVRGRDNLDRMLGSILVLEKVADQLRQLNALPEQLNQDFSDTSLPVPPNQDFSEE